MSDIYKYFAIVLFSLVCNSLFCDEPEDHKYISLLAFQVFLLEVLEPLLHG